MSKNKFLLNAFKVKNLKFNFTFQLDFAKGIKQNFMAYSMANKKKNQTSGDVILNSPW